MANPLHTLARLWGRGGHFYGGLFLPSGKERTADRPIEMLPAAPTLDVPLSPWGGAAFAPRVSPGQRVEAGDAVARGRSADDGAVAAPARGVVRGVGACDTPHATRVPCVRLDVDASGFAASGTVFVPPASSLTLDSMVEHARAVGLPAFTGFDADPPVPLASRLRAAAARGVDVLIVNALETDPCLTATWRIVTERADDVIAGAARLARLLNVRRVHLAVDAEARESVKYLTFIAHGTPVRVTPLVNAYPAGHPALLVHSIVGCEIAYGCADVDAGALVLDAATVEAAESSLRTGRPITRRIVTVGGDAVARPGNYDVMLGTPIRHVLEAVGLSRTPRRLVVGGPLTGAALHRVDAVVSLRTSAILAWSSDPRPARAAEACIRCGACVDDCPVGLNPVALLDAAERRDFDRAAALHVHACIGCGLCSYGCPSALPLAESIRAVQRCVAPVRARECEPEQAVRP